MNVTKGFFQTKITDNYGKSYELYASIDEDSITFEVFYRRSLISVIVGTVKSIIETPDILQLCDINIFEPPLIMSRGLLGRLWLLILRKRLPATYRRRGIGTVMLRTLLTLAKESGIRMVYGYVVGKDVNDNPGLLDWYQSHGFEISPCERKPPVPNCVACINLDMRNAVLLSAKAADEIAIIEENTEE
jgi:hypothetical protein